MRVCLVGLWVLALVPAQAQASTFLELGQALITADSTNLSGPVQVAIMLTIMSFIPFLIVAVTPFTRIIIVLAMLRQAFGMPTTPPNIVLITLALFLTVFTTLPLLQQVQNQALQPYLQGELSDRQALEQARTPLVKYLVSQTREQDMSLILSLAKTPPPERAIDMQLGHLIPAYMLSELRTAFEIGFVVFVPFVLVDIIVASVLMSLGMIMVPPLALSLPIKVLLFVLIDGWGLIAESLIRSFMI